MKIHRNLIDHWIETLSDLAKNVRRMNCEVNDKDIVNNIKSLQSYRRDVEYYNELEMELPQWLDEEMERFFIVLEGMSLNPESYRR